MTMLPALSDTKRVPLLTVLTDEGLRLFFPLAALYAALWPFIWVVALGFDLPLAHQVPPTLWHPHEMLIGAYGAALIGFVTTAVPEWTDTSRPSKTFLLAMALLWGGGRAVGLFGFDAAGSLGALADWGWLAMLLAYVGQVSWRRKSWDLSGLLLWLLVLLAAEGITRIGFLGGDLARASQGVAATSLAFLGLLGFALSRITVPVINRVLDPSEETSPYRPHPGRQNLAATLVFLAILGDIVGLSAEVRGYLALAAGAAFLDKAGEAFVGRSFFRAEVMCLFCAAALTGLGLIGVGAARLGAPFIESTAWHVVLMGGLGMSILAVLSIAGLFHTGHTFPFPWTSKAAFVLLCAATALRVLPDLGVLLPGGPHALATVTWASAFLLWLHGYWPILSDQRSIGSRAC
ncbi:MAG: NnrS family protein [Hyphomicrobiaceae bacterium]